MDQPGRSVAVEASILLVGLLAVALLAGMGWQDLQTLDRVRAWEELVNAIEIDVTRSHLWLEEHLGGDASVDVRADVRAPVAQAREACRVLEAGGIRGGSAVPPLPRGGAGGPGALCRGLDELATLTQRRLAADAGAGGAFDAAYDAHVRELERRLAGVDEGSHEALDRGRRQLLLRAGGVGLVVLAVTGGAAGTVRRWRRRLEAAAARDRSLLEASGDAIFGLDARGRVVVANPAAAELTGYPVDELEGRDLGELIEECEGRPPEECPTRRALIEGVPTRNREGTIRHRDGTEVVVESSTTPVTGPERILGAVKIARDVTARREAEKALVRSEERARRIVETAHDAYVEMDEAGRITAWNRAAEAVFGWSAEEVVGRDLAGTIVAPDLREAHRAGLSRYRETGEGPVLDQRLELRALHRSGRELPVELTIWRTSAEGEVTFSAFLRDITERQEAEAALRESHRRLAEAEKVAGFGSFEWDPAADQVVWSEGRYHLAGRDPDGFTPSFGAWAATVHPEDREAVVAEVRAAVAERRDYDIDYRIVTGEGEMREWHSLGHVVADDRGEVVRVLGTTRDVTEERRVERLKDEFTSVVSHELRTPLTSVHGALSLLDTGVVGELPDRVARLVGIAAQNTERLIRLVNDILDVERLASGRIELQPVPVAVDALMDEAVTAMLGMAERDGVALEVDGRAGVWVRADRDRILQVLTNLLSNAVKFSEPGGRVTVSARPRVDEVLVEVADQGRGIPPDQLEAVFGRFHQVDASDARERSGTGLGLAICRSIVEQHGGNIRAVSEGLGHGARMRFTLPVAAHPEEPAPEEGAGARDGSGPDRAEHDAAPDADASTGPRGRVPPPRVLVCDDDPRDRAGIVAALRGAGFEVSEAAGGRQCLRVAAADPPDVIVMDLLMPDLDGWATITRLADDPATAEIPVVVLSVVAPGEDARLGDEVVTWLTKAASRDELVGTVRRFTTRPSPRLLIVEDDPGLAGVLRELFGTRDLEIVHAATSAAAVAACGRTPPDLVLLDLELPDAHGLTVVDWLREHERLSGTPIVVYRATDLTAVERRRLGSAPVLTKSRVGLAEVTDRVFEVLDRVAGTACGRGTGGGG